MKGSARKSAGFTLLRRSAENGFTLVEMLIALLIFGLLSAGAVTLLSFSVASQDFTDRQLATLASIRRTGVLMTSDLAQATARPWRASDGRMQAAFFGAPGRETRILVLVRGGWDNPDQLPRPSLQRVEYRLQGGRLLRIGYTNVDGGGAAAVATLVDQIEQLDLKFRDRQGAWQVQWQPADPTELPTAVELTISSPRFGPIRQVFLVGTGA